MEMNFFGLKVVQAPMIAKYTLPAEVIPGVPWPPGFREEINAWSRQFLGETCMLPAGHAYLLGEPVHTVVMHPDYYAKLRGLQP